MTVRGTEGGRRRWWGLQKEAAGWDRWNERRSSLLISSWSSHFGFPWGVKGVGKLGQGTDGDKGWEQTSWGTCQRDNWRQVTAEWVSVRTSWSWNGEGVIFLCSAWQKGQRKEKLAFVWDGVQRRQQISWCWWEDIKMSGYLDQDGRGRTQTELTGQKWSKKYTRVRLKNRVAGSGSGRAEGWDVWLRKECDGFGGWNTHADWSRAWWYYTENSSSPWKLCAWSRACLNTSAATTSTTTTTTSRSNNASWTLAAMMW